MRIFISIEIPEEIKEKIEKLVNSMKLMLTPIKWADKKNLHVTLKFLGWVADEKLPEMKKCIADCVRGFGPFTLNFAGIGSFPDQKHPRAIWVALNEGADRSKKLADKIDCEISRQGFREEEREFTPHLTIGRIKEKVDVAALSKFVLEHGGTDFGSMKVGHISIMKSTLRRSGPTYEELDQVKI